MAHGLRFLVKLIARLTVATLVVLATFNPSGYSYFHWVFDVRGGHVWLKIAVGVVLFMIYYVLLNITFAAFRRIGVIAAALTSVLFASQLILLFAPGWLFQSWNGYFLIVQYVLLLSFAIVLALGISWSSIIERVTGQQQKRYVAGPPAQR